MSGHIGIVACSSEGAALCYRTICAESERFMGAHDHLEVSMHNFPLRDYMDFIECDDWRGVGQLMLRSAEKLAAIGADFAICPDNTIHRALRHVGGLSPIPWLDIAEVVARNVAERRYRRVGLLGVPACSESSLVCSRPDAMPSCSRARNFRSSSMTQTPHCRQSTQRVCSRSKH